MMHGLNFSLNYLCMSEGTELLPYDWLTRYLHSPAVSQWQVQEEHFATDSIYPYAWLIKCFAFELKLLNDEVCRKVLAKAYVLYAEM